ncbi:MAG TPA: hypothetical protein VKB93_09780 [Thermoanaerobaculia bacterium]|nr:hypothetical protein [Thermoanaerobaculia bacterium]
MRALLTLLLLVSATVLQADDPMCATSEANDARVRALHDRTFARPRLMPNAASAPIAREGAFYLGVDDRVAPGHRPFDLAGKSLIFEPRTSGYAVRRENLRWYEPASEPVRDFSTGTTTSVKYDIAGTPPVLFGQPVTTLYLTAFNSIHLTPPVNDPAANQFDELESAVYPRALLSPLMITNRKPSRLAYPRLYVERRDGHLVITWLSTTGSSFGYAVQAELHTDGTIVYSYQSMRDMQWGTPIVSAGFNAASAQRRTLATVSDARSDLVSGTYNAALADVNDLRTLEIARVGESELLAVRLTLAAPVDLASLTDGKSLRYALQIDQLTSWLDITSAGWTFTPLGAPRAIANGNGVRFDGNAIELFGVQPAGVGATFVRAWSLTPGTNRTIDFAQIATVPFETPLNHIASDLSSVASNNVLALPIAEPFVLGEFDPLEVWNRLQSTYALSSYDVDAVAMYQSFYTDIIFYAGAYSTGGNPGVDGIYASSTSRGTKAFRSPALLHMNQLTYGWNATERNSSHVMMHELGHRWLYAFRIMENGQLARPLSPVSSHPAAFVHAPAAFPVYEETESSVMGGANFSSESDGRFRAHAANYGYSWTDLYLMGLATPEEVQPWFYLANSNPELPKEYYAPDNQVVSGDRRDVKFDQLTAAEGVRNPPAALSQRVFRVLYVLVTENGAPTNEEVAKMNEWRALLEKNFAIATGGRARIATEYVTVPKKRAVR